MDNTTFKPQTSYELTNIMLTLKTHVFSGNLRQVRLVREESTFKNPKSSLVVTFQVHNVMKCINQCNGYLINKYIWLFIYLVSMYSIGCGIQCGSTLRLFRHIGLGVWQIGIRAIVYSELSIFFQENYNYRHGAITSD